MSSSVDLPGLIDAALLHGGGTHTREDVVELIRRGEAEMWATQDGKNVVVTEIVDYPTRRTLRFSLAAGDLDVIIPELYLPLLDYGRARRCENAEIWGRPGWERALPGPWRRRMVVCTRSLEDN